MNRIVFGSLLFAFALTAQGATLYSCPFQGSSGDRIDRGFYVQSYPGSTLDTVTLNYTAGTNGSYTIALAAHINTFDGPLVGPPMTTTLDLGTVGTQKFAWNFGGAAVPVGATVAFVQTLVAGPGALFYDVGNGPCPNVVETNGTSPPLDETRRDSIGLTITGSNELNPANYQGTWWNSPAGSQSGWGINFSHQGNTIFASWFTFDVDGSPLWMVVAATKTGAGTYSGTLYRGTGPAFNAVPFDPAQVAGSAVGTATFTFADASNGTFAYTIGAVSQAKSITKQVFASPVPVCAWGTQPNLALATNYQDTWWAAPAGSESGWGVNLAHQGDTIFATWFTFGFDGKPVWLVVAATKTGPGVYAGKLYTGTGPRYDQPFDPSKVVPAEVGSATFAFADGANATFSYTYAGVSQTKAIVRQVFAAPGTSCH